MYISVFETGVVFRAKTEMYFVPPRPSAAGESSRSEDYDSPHKVLEVFFPCLVDAWIANEKYLDFRSRRFVTITLLRN
jgi:hypothetical protein